jgi:outer membrane cobalamin receptor
MGTRPDVVLFDMLATVRAAPRFEVYGRLENLLDARYQTAFDRPGAPRTAVLGLRITN